MGILVLRLALRELARCRARTLFLSLLVAVQCTLLGGALMTDTSENIDETAASLLQRADINILLWVSLLIITTVVFTSSTQQQLTTVGVLSVSGASRRLIRASLALQGTCTAVLGLLVSAAAIAVPRAIGRRPFGALLGSGNLTEGLPVGRLLALGLLTTLLLTVAAYVPARTASKVPVLDALAGRRPHSRVPRALAKIGVGCLVSGIGAALLTLLGVVGGEPSDGVPDSFLLPAALGALLTTAGVCLVSPIAARAIQLLTSKAHGPALLAGRTLAQHRASTSLVVSLVAAVTCIGTGVGTMTVSANHSVRQDMESGGLPANVVMVTAQHCPAGRFSFEDRAPGEPAEMCRLIEPGRNSVVQVQSILDGAVRVPLRWATFDPAPVVDDGSYTEKPAREIIEPGGILVATEQLLDLIGVNRADREGLERTGMLEISDPHLWGTTWFPAGRFDPTTHTSAVVIRTRSGDLALRAQASTELPARWRLQSVLITEAKASALGLPIRELGVLFVQRGRITESQQRQLSEFENAAWPTDESNDVDMLRLDYSHDGTPPVNWPLELGVAIAVLVTALLSAGLGRSLHPAEEQDERNLLIAIGVNASRRSSVHAWRALLLAGLGILLAVPPSLVTASALTNAYYDRLSWAKGTVVPWLLLGLLLCVPLVTYGFVFAATGIASRRRPQFVALRGTG